jgi:hypothetical protein
LFNFCALLAFFLSHRWTSYADKMLHNKFDGTVGFSIDGGIKDSTHIRRLATEHDSPMPAIDSTHHHLLTARALHEAQARTGTTSFPVLDWSALIAGTRVAAGLDAFGGAKVRFSFDLSHRFALWNLLMIVIYRILALSPKPSKTK